MVLPGMLYGKVARSPHPHALIKSIDTGRAARVEGVKAILTHLDAPPNWRGGTPPVVRVVDAKVRFAGDAVALVAATTEEAAEEAASLIRVEYQELPPVFDPEEALKPGAPELYAEFPGNVVTPGLPAFGPKCLTELVMGDPEKGLAEADVVVEGSAAYENLPNPISAEPPGVIAWWEAPEAVTLWVSSQSPFRDAEIVRRVLGEQVKVRTIGLTCGGSFGSKALSWLWYCYAVLLSRATGRPVKMVMSREEQLATFTLRPGCRLQAKIGMKKDGTVTAVVGRWLIDTGYYSRTTQAQVAVGLGELQLMLRCRNWNLKPTIVCTNRAASGQVRGFGGQELKAVVMPVLSRALAELDLDPFEFLKKNYVKPGDGYYWRDGLWYVYRGVDYAAAMDKGAQVFGWREKWKGWLKPTTVNGAKRTGVGVCVHGNADIGEDASEAIVRLQPDGTAVLLFCVAEHGTGQKSNYAKMVAEVLQLPLDRVQVTPADSLISPYVGPGGGSRGTYAIGSAVIRAAEDAKARLLEVLAPKLGVHPEELETENGEVFIKADPERRLPWRAMGVDRTIVGFGRFEPDYTLANCLMSFVEVEVDTETGQVSLLRVVNATDVGTIIDPLGLRGQLNGCLGSAGIDSALFEETVLDSQHGWVLNANLVEYKWRTFADLPPIENVILETPFPSHRFGAVGIGEIATSPGPAAVLMAVSNALGTWITEYPLTPERVLKALAKVKCSAEPGGAVKGHSSGSEPCAHLPQRVGGKVAAAARILTGVAKGTNRNHVEWLVEQS
jgi:xanthine dehydrogenase molybdenum-binding subunit